MNTNILILAVIALVIYFYMYSNTEKFTDNENILGQKILEFFKQPIHPFSDYLSVLTNNNNTSDNLISKGVYNKFKNNTNLTINDIMNEF